METKTEASYSQTKQIETPCGKIYTTVTFTDELQPVRLFITAGKGSNCLNTQLRIIATLVTRCFQHGVGLNEIIEDIRKNYCGIEHASRFLSCSDAIAGYLTEIRRSYMDGGIEKMLNIKQEM